MSDEHKDDCGHCCGGDDHEPPKGSLVLNAEVKVSGETVLRVAGMDCPDEVAAIEC